MGHGPGRGMMPGEKAKDFTGTIQKLFAYLGSYRIVLGVVILFAIGSTVFNIIGPKVLSKVTTELFNGLVAKVSGTGGIDFEKIGRILLLLLPLTTLRPLKAKDSRKRLPMLLPLLRQILRPLLPTHRPIRSSTALPLRSLLATAASR